MKISLKWLNEYIEVSDFLKRPEQLAKILTDAGLEVEAIEDQARPFERVVVGQVKVLGQHPDADKLTLCQVDVGEPILRQIVCGAKNHREGDKVVVTLPGAVLPGDFAIKESSIRGVISQGMMASEKELGLSAESEGIMILPEEAEVGMPFARYAHLDDVLFEISVTPNRADCLSHWGLARELALSLDRPLKAPVFDLITELIDAPVKVEVQDEKACPRYAGRWIKGVRVGPSPDWLRRRLEGVGSSSINNVVDVTNYVMLELGQPLHAFDLNAIGSEGDRRLFIAKAEEGENFTTLDGTNLKLKNEDLTIRDQDKPLALAGLIGGENSGVSEQTTDLFIESAFFQSKRVRQSSRRHGIDTESGQRFSRGVDPEGVIKALNRACSLIQQVAGGVVSKDCIDLYPTPVERSKVVIRLSYVRERLGDESLSASDVESTLNRLQCQMISKKTDEWQVVPPAFRWDLVDEWDFVEEVARLRGYDQIEEAFPPLTASPQVNDPNVLFERRVEDLMVLEGFRQMVHFHFVSDEVQKEWIKPEAFNQMGLKTSDESIRIQNPLSNDFNVMRKSLVVSMVDALNLNLRQGVEQGQAFELGRVYHGGVDVGEETTRLGGIAWGHHEQFWNRASSAPLVFQIKGTVERVLAQLQIKSFRWISVQKAAWPQFLHPGQRAKLNVEGRDIGFIGSLHPAIKEAEKIKGDVALFELDLEALKKGQPRRLKVKDFSKYPGVSRDLAFVMPRVQETGALLSHLAKGAGNFFQSAQVIDLYQGAPLNEDDKSVTYRIYLQKIDGTLADQEIQQAMTGAADQVKSKLGFELR